MDYTDKFYKKYLKYKLKYNKLKYDKMDHGLNIKKKDLNGGTRYDCVPENKFKEICIEKENGKYRSKEGCENDCELQYIRNELKKINIDRESAQFYLFIKDIIANEKINVFLKGGNVLGLKVLKMIHNKYKNDDEKFKKVFTEFLKLDLIKDWDFAGYTKNPITPEYREHIDEVAKKYKLHQRASKFMLYQTKRPILLEGKPLFEIAVLDSDTFSKLEIPLTTMKVKVNEYNVKYVFMFCKIFYAYKEKGEEFDFDILKRMLDRIDVIIYPHKNGLYNVTNNFDKGSLNDEILEFIRPFEDFDKNLPQFLATHIEDPFRILYRLPEKNMPKNDKIKQFLNTINIKNEDWLFDSTFIDKIIVMFCEKLGDKLLDIYKTEYINTHDVKKSIEKIDSFMIGTSFSRIEIDYAMITPKGKSMLKSIFENIIKEIGKKDINDMEFNSKFFKFVKFLTNKMF